MNCREFRQKHDSYIDDTLAGVDIEAMRRHLRFCDACSRHDTRIRRALLVARNMPAIELSADFGRRLSTRLMNERLALHAEPMRGRGSAPFVVVAVGLLVVAVAGAAMIPREETSVRLAPVLAQAPEPEMVAPSPAMVAAMPAGISVWPAVFAAQQASWHFAEDERTR